MHTARTFRTTRYSYVSGIDTDRQRHRVPEAVRA